MIHWSHISATTSPGRSLLSVTLLFNQTTSLYADLGPGLRVGWEGGRGDGRKSIKLFLQASFLIEVKLYWVDANIYSDISWTSKLQAPSIIQYAPNSSVITSHTHPHGVSSDRRRSTEHVHHRHHHGEHAHHSAREIVQRPDSRAYHHTTATAMKTPNQPSWAMQALVSWAEKRGWARDYGSFTMLNQTFDNRVEA